MINQNISIVTGSFIAGAYLLTLPKDRTVVQGVGSRIITLYPQDVRIINNSDKDISYNILLNDEELTDSIENPSWFHSIKILSGKTEKLYGMGKYKYLKLFSSSSFTGSVDLVMIDFKAK